MKSNFRQYGQMETQRWKSQGREKRQERKSQKKDDPGGRKGKKKVAKHGLFPMFWLRKVEKAG